MDILITDNTYILETRRAMQSYTFRSCTLKNLEERFGIRRTLTSQTLDSWLQTEAELSEQERLMLDHWQQLLIENAETWNERELTQNFIGPVFSLIRLSELYRFNLFAERKISAVISGVTEEIELTGEPDGMVATGYWAPEIPMFAFSEYKRLLDPNGDPAGQTVAAMLVGQELNQESNPIYGCYVIGNAWRFVILEEKSYTISKDYSALKDELYDIFRILKALKQIIVEFTR